MKRFNLLNEAWIKVVCNDKGKVEEVSILEIFTNAPNYLRLAGETEAQNFAILRSCFLSVLHTVFSRLDAGGKPYDCVTLDENFKPIQQIDFDEADDYYEGLQQTWSELWARGSFPEIVCQYLLKWSEHFYLFAEDFPFFQVSADDLLAFELIKFKADNFSGKNLNRVISESGNKIAMFSPKYAKNNNKEILSPAEIARWLVAFQGYIGLADKASINTGEKYKSSKGWLFDLGGLYLEGDNLFETLMLNFILPQEENLDLSYIPQQRPCWEYSGADFVKRRLASDLVDNLAELYTVWGRAIYINPEIDTSKPFSMGIIKLPELNHQETRLEPMTIWRWNEQGPNKGTFTPRKHVAKEALWQAFNIIAIQGENQRRPGVMQWLEQIEDYLDTSIIKFKSVSLQDDGNATSWVPTDDISDDLQLKNHILFDSGTERWTIRIDAEVQLIKKLISWHLKAFASDLNNIRNSKNTGFVADVERRAYFEVDQPFRQWLISIEPADSPEVKIREWRQYLFKLLKEQADGLVANAGKRDYLGRVIKKNENDQGRELNIAIAYSNFLNKLKRGVESNE